MSASCKSAADVDIATPKWAQALSERLDDITTSATHHERLLVLQASTSGGAVGQTGPNTGRRENKANRTSAVCLTEGLTHLMNR